MIVAWMAMMGANTALAAPDWLLDARGYRTQVVRSRDGSEVTIGNGLVSRRFRVAPFFGSVSMRREETGEEFLRAIEPDLSLTLDDAQVLVGGVKSQPDRAFIQPDWLPNLAPLGSEARLESVEESPMAPRFEGAPVLRGKSIRFRFRVRRLNLQVVYEIPDGLPVVSKHFELSNEGTEPVRLNRYVLERLAFAEAESNVDATSRWTLPNWSLLTDYAFGGMGTNDLNQTLDYQADPSYETQVNYERTMPALLEVAPKVGPGTDLRPGQTFRSLRVFEILHDSRDRERQGLAVRRFYRAYAPWVTQNPLMMHVTTTDDAKVREAIDQAADVGFEMIILSFGSGLNMEDVSEGNIAKFRRLADYAKSKGLRFGGYSLLASRRISEEDDVIDPKTGKTGQARFGNSPCLGSKWGLSYFERLRKFISETGFNVLEHDGSYPGDVCASTSHPGHRGLEDSQSSQYRMITDFYHWCRQHDVFLNVPDTYHLQGSNKTGMGYRETNWSLPREQQHLHARQNLFDGTWEKTPSMGWMFVPLVEYHGGGAAATIEPLKDHLSDYRQHLYNNLGYGAQACYRGPRLYDAPETRTMVKEAVDWFKRYRRILEADVVHLRRPDGRDWDGILHVLPGASDGVIGMAVVYNPLDEKIVRTISLPVRFATREVAVRLAVEGGKPHLLETGGQGTAQWRVEIPARGFTWAVLSESPKV